LATLGELGWTVCPWIAVSWVGPEGEAAVRLMDALVVAALPVLFYWVVDSQ
jgi:hypothetical protein